MRSLSSKILLLILCLPLLTHANTAACNIAIQGRSAGMILQATMATMHNMFPIKIGGAVVGTAAGLEDIASIVPPVCGPCLLPIPQPGVQFSFWEAIAIIEVTSVPYCYPSFQIAAGIGVGAGAFSLGNRPTGTESVLRTYQTHYVQYPLLHLLGMLLDGAACGGGASDISIPYMSEVDPLWQNDLWSSYIHPEVYLVSNPFVQLSCSVDSVASTVGFPLDFMWWCLGAWGSSYPINASSVSTTSNTAALTIAARTLFLMHRLLQLPLTVGPHMSTGACTAIPSSPLMLKSTYAFVPVFPTIWPNRIPLGRSGLLWEYMMDTAMANHGVYAIIVYRKMDCCMRAL